MLQQSNRVQKLFFPHIDADDTSLLGKKDDGMQYRPDVKGKMSVLSDSPIHKVGKNASISKLYMLLLSDFFPYKMAIPAGLNQDRYIAMF